MPAASPYPQPPWTLRGEMWIAFLRTVRPLTVPSGLTVVGNPCRIMVVGAHYGEGSTLSYHEFAVGSVVRNRARVGIHTHHLWVDDEQSVRGGQQIWGLPKKLAGFGGELTDLVIDAPDGSKTSCRLVRTGRLAVPTVPVLAALTGFGQRDGRWIRSKARATAMAGLAECHVEAWSDSLPQLATTRGRAVHLRSLVMKVR